MTSLGPTAVASPVENGRLRLSASRPPVAAPSSPSASSRRSRPTSAPSGVVTRRASTPRAHTCACLTRRDVQPVGGRAGLHDLLRRRDRVGAQLPAAQQPQHDAPLVHHCTGVEARRRQPHCSAAVLSLSGPSTAANSRQPSCPSLEEPPLRPHNAYLYSVSSPTAISTDRMYEMTSSDQHERSDSGGSGRVGTLVRCRARGRRATRQ